MSVLEELETAEFVGWRRRGWYGVLGHTHTYSGRSDHGGAERPPESYHKLVAWARERRIDAIGMGSPYTPREANTHSRFDEIDRDRYYRRDFDKFAARDDGEVAAMLDQANTIAGDDGPLCYLDNETPKGRFGHMWWLGWQYDFPSWHDYDQVFDRWMLNDLSADNIDDEPMAYERRAYSQIIALQRAQGALGFWAHPTSWWRGSHGQFVTNIASEMPAHVIADGYLDGLVIMGYQPYRPQYLALWFALLDRGYRVPGIAEMDCGLSDPCTWQRPMAMLTHARLPEGEPVSVSSLTDAFRRGRLFVSSGPLVELTVDGRGHGEVVCASDRRSHAVRIVVQPDPNHPVPLRVDLIRRGGEVVWSRRHFMGGQIELQIPAASMRDYLVVRVLDSDEFDADHRLPRQVAISNPVYLHPQGQTFNQPATTEVDVHVSEASVFAGGEIRFETAAGELLLAATASGGARVAETLPANGRVTIVGPGGQFRTDYLINANHAVQAAQRYLYRGRFLSDFPSLVSGEVPPHVWRLDRFAEAMRTLQLTY